MIWFISGIIVGIAISFAYWIYTLLYFMINWFDR